MILVVSHREDDHAVVVLERLQSAGEDAVLLDLARFPRELQLAFSCASDEAPRAVIAAEDSAEPIELDRCEVIWWRRPQPLELDPGIADPDARAFAYAESHAAIHGLWPLLDALWVNDPSRDDIASRKPYQLKVAREVGFEIPVTLVANDPGRVREFIAERGNGTIYKAFSATPRAWRETRMLREDEIQLLDAVALAPVIFQEYVPAEFDLRVTMVDGRPHAAAIHSQETPYGVDYRMHMDEARVEPFDLPVEVVERLRAFMDRLGLLYGAIDLRRTPDGRFVFLEVNPSGQWRFVEERTGLGITEAFVTLLRTGAGSLPD